MNRVSYQFNNRQQGGGRPLTTMSRSGLQPYQSAQEMSRSRMQASQPHWKEKEGLYDENIHLKMSNNQFKEENQRLKLAKLQLERELFRFEKFIEDQSKMQYQVPNGTVVRSPQMEVILNKLQKRSGLVIKLKSKQKSLVQELIEAKNQIDELKRCYKTTRIQELEIELQNALDETVRLRQQLLHIQRIIELQHPSQDGTTLEERYILQEKTLKSLQNDNQDMHKSLRDLEQTNRSLRVKLDETEKNHTSSNKENMRLQHIITDLQRDIKQTQIKPIIKHEEPHSHTVQLQYIQQMATQKQHFEEILERKDIEMEELRLVIEQKDEKIADLQSQIPGPELEKDQQQPTYTLEALEEEPPMVPEPIPEIQMSPQPKRRMPRVRFYDVENIGHALRIMLHRNQIPFNEIDSYFNNFDTNVSIAQLKQIFRCDPFGVVDQSQLIILCRYLVEDNQEEFIIYDEDRHNDLTVVKSIFKKLLGRYDLFGQAEEEQLTNELKKKLTPSMIDTVQMIINKKKMNPGECDSADFEAALKFHEVVLSQRQMELLNLRIFRLSGNLNIIRYKDLITEFAPK